MYPDDNQCYTLLDNQGCTENFKMPWALNIFLAHSDWAKGNLPWALTK